MINYIPWNTEHARYNPAHQAHVGINARKYLKNNIYISFMLPCYSEKEDNHKQEDTLCEKVTETQWAKNIERHTDREMKGHKERQRERRRERKKRRALEKERNERLSAKI